MPDLKQFKEWDQPENADLTVEEVIKMYERGFAGAKPSTPETRDKYEEAVLTTESGVLTAAEAASKYNWEDSHVGELVIPFVYIGQVYPGCLPGPAQARGDCVSHSGKNARLLTLCCEIILAKPDEISGKIEQAPLILPEGIKNGALSTEASYWFRGHGGDGWQCESDARVALKNAGCVVRQNYPEIGIDLTKYSGSLAGRYGRSAPPSEIADALDNNLIRTSTNVESFEEIRDLLGNGYGISGCGSEGYSDTRDENGVSKKSGSWAHAMAVIGADDRAEIKKLYGEPLILILNSWGRWNSGPRRILGTTIDIPEGAFWVRWSQAKNRRYIAFSSVNGWPMRVLPPFSFPGVFI
jgi:hypothetical protein